MSFSERMGLKPTAKLAQVESMDDELRNSLWSLLSAFVWDSFKGADDGYMGTSTEVRGSTLSSLMLFIWLDFYKKPIDNIPKYWPDCHRALRESFFAMAWNEVYDFVEFVAQHFDGQKKTAFVTACNTYLIKENSGYRFIDDVLIPVTSPEEVAEVEEALDAADKYPGVKPHLKAAIGFLSDRKKADYRNSIKESISAVEALAKTLANDKAGTLGDLLKQLEKIKKLHPALKTAFNALYGYTNDADGIRHALLDNGTSLTKADARFMLICCSAFVNYAIETIG